MSKIKPGLGRGLDALINPEAVINSNKLSTKTNIEELSKDDGKSVNILAKIPVNLISNNPYQPRTEFNPEALADLTKSILENGLIQPVTVRRLDESNYELISGERRLRACREIGYKEIPAYIIKVDSKEAILALSLIENIQREDLNPIEVAVAYKRLMEECSLSQEEIAERVGKNRSTVTNTIRLLKLPEEIQKSLIQGEISAGHARALITINNREFQLAIFRNIVKNSLTVRKVEALVQEMSKPASNKPKEQKKTEGKTRYSISKTDIENKLRSILGTKVSCSQKKDGTGELKIEFYSNDELERLFDLLSLIEDANI